MVELDILLNNGFTINIKANVVPNVTRLFERKPIKNKSIKEVLKKYELADTLPSSCKKCDFDLPIGNEYYADVVSMKRITRKDELFVRFEIGIDHLWPNTI